MRLMALPVALAAVAAVTTGSSAAVLEPPACTPSQLAGTREGIPLKILDPSSESFPDSDTSLATLVTGHRYAAVIDETRATRESTATEGSSVPVSGTVRVSAPSGLALTPATKDSTDYYVFNAPAPGTLRIQAMWQQEVSGVRSSASTICSATAALDAAVVAPNLVVTTARFYAGYRFEVRVRNRPPADPRSVTALLRVRRGVATPPPASGRVASRVSFDPLNPGAPSVAYRSALKLHFGAESDNGGVSVQVDPDGNFPHGTQLRYGFSLELRQGGRRVGGMRSGVVCRRVQFNGYSQPRCTHPGFTARP